MVYLLGFDIEFYIDYVDIIKKIISLKQLDGYKVDNEINTLNYRYIQKQGGVIIAFASRGPMRFQHINLLKDVDADLLFIRDVPDAWYNKGLLYLTNNVDGQ